MMLMAASVRNFGYQKSRIMKTDKIIYWIATGLVSAGMLLSAFMYLSRNEDLLKSFEAIGLPVYIVMLLGVAKLIGAVLLLAPVASRFKEWAYAGFLFTFGGAVWVHAATATPWIAPLVFLAVLSVSYVYWNKLKGVAA
jgi:uncharacterized membrane protein YphA (DoxX/SURF4 family)